MITLTRTDSDNPDFIELVRQLDADLAEKNGEQDSFYAQFNKIAKIKYVILAYDEGQAVACGAIKEYEPGAMEVKRMYTSPASRGKGIASQVLTGLETWAMELNYSTCILETGRKQLDAVRLYEKNRYERISNYGQYAGVEESVCFEKKLQ